MSEFFDDTIQGLMGLIEKGDIPMKEQKGIRVLLKNKNYGTILVI